MKKENNRKVLEERITDSMSVVLTKEQHKELKEMLSQMSDTEFFSMIEYAKNKAESDNTSLKDALDINQKILATKSRDFLEKTACNNIKAKFLSEEENQNSLKDIKKSKPTDLIELNKESLDSLIQLIPYDENKISGIPSDILFLDTIPLPDIIIRCNRANEIDDFRVVIYPDYKSRIDKSDENNPAKVGAIILNVDKEAKIFKEFEVIKGLNNIVSTCNLGFYKLNLKSREYLIDNFSSVEFSKAFSVGLSIWYAIQIALLNPVIKDVFRYPTIDVIKENSTVNNKSKKKKKQKVRYIKKYVINADDINKRRNSHYERKTYSWYVIGHWRTYKNGKRIFIKPYWKGILRDSKKYNSSDDIRERDVVISNKIN